MNDNQNDNLNQSGGMPSPVQPQQPVADQPTDATGMPNLNDMPNPVQPQQPGMPETPVADTPAAPAAPVNESPVGGAEPVQQPESPMGQQTPANTGVTEPAGGVNNDEGSQQ